MATPYEDAESLSKLNFIGSNRLKPSLLTLKLLNLKQSPGSLPPFSAFVLRAELFNSPGVYVID
jgi:hypothetical protein